MSSRFTNPGRMCSIPVTSPVTGFHCTTSPDWISCCDGVVLTAWLPRGAGTNGSRRAEGSLRRLSHWPTGPCHSRIENDRVPVPTPTVAATSPPTAEASTYTRLNSPSGSFSRSPAGTSTFFAPGAFDPSSNLTPSSVNLCGRSSAASVCPWPSKSPSARRPSDEMPSRLKGSVSGAEVRCGAVSGAGGGVLPRPCDAKASADPPATAGVRRTAIARG